MSQWCKYCNRNFKSLLQHLNKSDVCCETAENDSPFLLDMSMEDRGVNMSVDDNEFEFIGGGSEISVIDQDEQTQEDSFLHNEVSVLEPYLTFELHDSDEIAQLLLLRILQKINAPKYTHEMIRRLIQYCVANQVEVNNLRRRRAAIDYFVKKYNMGTMRPTTVTTKVQVLDKEQVIKSKQKGSKVKYKCRTFNPYAQERNILDDEIPQEAEAEEETEVEQDELIAEQERKTGVESIYDPAELKPVTLKDMENDIHTDHWAITTTDIEIVVFPLAECLKHLLIQRHDLMKPDNLVVNKSGFPNPDPWAMYEDDTNGVLSEIHTGSWYRNAYQHCIKDKTTEFLCPIIIFIDHTITEFMGRYGLEPVVATFTIFNETTRRNPTAWIPLGFIPDVYKFKSKAQVDKERGYIKGIHQMNTHRCLDKILEQLYQIQQAGGLDLNVTLTGEEAGRQFRRWKFPVALVLGDTVGNDCLCGRFVYYGTQVGRINRACDCPGSSSNDPDYKCRWTEQKEIEALMGKTEEERQEQSHHFIKNAFHRICFGGCKYGIHGCTPVDILHTLLHGIYRYTKETFFSIAGRDLVSIIDNLVIQLGRQARCRGRNPYPRVYFGKGISNLTQTTALENSGALMMLLLALLTADGQKAVEQRNQSSSQTLYLDNYIKLFEMLLCYEQWTRLSTMWNRNDEEAAVSADKAIRVFLKFTKDTADRVQGQGWSLSKFHEMLHVVWCISRYGSTRNFDAGIGESNHKWLAKSPSKTALKTHGTFEVQSAANLFDQYVISRAMHDNLQKGAIDHEFQEFFPSEVPKPDPIVDDQVPTDAMVNNCTEFVIEEHYDEECGESFWIMLHKLERGVVYSEMMDPYLVRMLYHTYIAGFPQPQNDDNDRQYKRKVNANLEDREQVIFISEFRPTKERLYRAHPHYQSRAPWYDWVIICNTRGNLFVCQVQMFVKWYSRKKQIFITEAIIRQSTKPIGGGEGSVLTEPFELEENGVADSGAKGLCLEEEVFCPRYRRIDANLLQEHVFCIQDIGAKSNKNIYVYPLEEWGKKFHDPSPNQYQYSDFS